MRLFFLLLQLAAIVCHNYIRSPSRSPFASTFHPAIPRRTSTPHLIAGPGDEFQIEYLPGHGGATFLAVLHENDEPQLKRATEQMLEDYIANAPIDQAAKPPPRRFAKFHRKNLETYETNLLDNNYRDSKGVVQPRPDFYLKEVLPSDPDYLPRPKRYGPARKLMEFKPQHLKNDRYAHYASEKYPWLLSVQKFGHEALQPARPDMARVVIPEGSPSGFYSVWYYWRGYRDIIDVLYNATARSTTEEMMYGETSSRTWSKVDHCWFPDSRGLRSDCIEIVGNTLAECLSSCERSFGCEGVLSSPVLLPDTVPERWRDMGGRNGHLPWNTTGSVSTKSFTCERDAFQHADKNTFACVGLRPRTATDTYEQYEVVNDPMSPHFYSTCHLFRFSISFQQLPPDEVAPVVPWRTANRQCVSCQNKANYEIVNTTVYSSIIKKRYNYVTPLWDVPEHCVNCDAEPAQGERVLPFSNARADATVPKVVDTTCDGVYRVNSSYHAFEYRAGASDTCGGTPRACWKRVELAGNTENTSRSRVWTPFLCQHVAYHDAECDNSQKAVLIRTKFMPCYCRRVDRSCCPKTCVEVTNRDTTVITLDEPAKFNLY